MPTDFKRLTGPTDSKSYKLFTRSTPLDQRDLFDSNKVRLDKRKNDEHRKIFFRAGVSNQSKGSAYIEVGNTKVLVSVHLPRENPNRSEYSAKGSIYCEFKYAPFSCPTRRQHQLDSEEKQCSSVMKQALEPAICLHEFPNFQVDIYAVVLENDGSALSAAITCAGVALAHAGFAMYDLVTSVTIGIRRDNLLIDPTYHEEVMCNLPLGQSADGQQEEYGSVTLTMLNTHKQVSQFYQTGMQGLKTIEQCSELLVDAHKCLIPLVQKVLVKHVHDSQKEKNKSMEE